MFSQTLTRRPLYLHSAGCLMADARVHVSMAAQNSLTFDFLSSAAFWQLKTHICCLTSRGSSGTFHWERNTRYCWTTRCKLADSLLRLAWLNVFGERPSFGSQCLRSGLPKESTKIKIKRLNYKNETTLISQPQFWRRTCVKCKYKSNEMTQTSNKALFYS